MFRVTIKRNLFHKVLVELTHDDEYKVTLWGGKRKAINCGTIEVVECCCENLADVVYDLCNSQEIRQIAI
jgi:ureidoglycolate hydrolase